jgi:transposase
LSVVGRRTQERRHRRRHLGFALLVQMERFPSVKHFCAWLGVAPRNDVSGGKVLRSRTMKVVNRATQAFRQAAQSVSCSDSELGAFYRAMRARKGPQHPVVATAHKIARIVYHLLNYGEPHFA